ncbi:hypothetical protein [Salimicrobium flavidum]|uniref:Uncharacterized protein n=1 Tax=Salimicrobium flavidum TaxID=570947 RepID=A0A1N7JNG2_9BACI|nr:hypothetical protein [Salimicrobium flavidum]SIS50878.1 hypothetical protein SAMN05421687_10728 [Salimicrobium flavidum]
MKRYYSLLAIVLSAMGAFFFFRQFSIPVLSDRLAEVSLLVFLSVGLFIHARRSRDTLLLFFQSMVLLILWQLFAEPRISAWPSHWAIYVIYSGVALALARKPKIAIVPFAIGLGIMFIPAIESLFFWLPPVIQYIELYFSVFFLLLAGYYFYKLR